MSAKWRRNRTNSKKFDILKVFNRVKNKNVGQRFRMKIQVPRNRRIHTGIEFEAFLQKRSCREPKHLVDVLEGTDEIIVVAEFAGFNREDLRVHVKGDKLTLSLKRWIINTAKA